MILVLDNAKMHNTVLLRKYGAGNITVQREESDSKGGKKVVTRNVDVPESGSFPNSNSKNLATVLQESIFRVGHSGIFFQLRHPEKLMEKVESFMHGPYACMAGSRSTANCARA